MPVEPRCPWISASQAPPRSSEPSPNLAELPADLSEPSPSRIAREDHLADTRFIVGGGLTLRGHRSRFGLEVCKAPARLSLGLDLHVASESDELAVEALGRRR